MTLRTFAVSDTGGTYLVRRECRHGGQAQPSSAPQGRSLFQIWEDVRLSAAQIHRRRQIHKRIIIMLTKKVSGRREPFQTYAECHRKDISTIRFCVIGIKYGM